MRFRTLSVLPQERFAVFPKAPFGVGNLVLVALMSGSAPTTRRMSRNFAQCELFPGIPAATFVRLGAIPRSTPVSKFERVVMRYAVIVAGALSALVLGACERPSPVSTPAPGAVVMVPVPGPAGPQGEEGKVGNMGPSGMVGSPGMTGSPGMMGTQGEKGAEGEQGKTGGDTTVVVVPAK